jgi:hypothetical protein
LKLSLAREGLGEPEVTAETITLMKRGLMLINTARGAADAGTIIDALKGREYWYQHRFLRRKKGS